MARPPQRGDHVLDAALELLAEDGLAGVSMRSVANRAGVSLAQVQYYFHAKADLISAAYDRVSEEFLATLHPVLAGEPSIERFRTVWWQWLPLDAVSEKRARVWLAYAASAATDRELAPRTARLDAEIRRWSAVQLADLQAAGALRSGFDPADVAGQLLALVDGLTVHCLAIEPPDRRPLADRVLGPWFDDLVDR